MNKRTLAFTTAIVSLSVASLAFAKTTNVSEVKEKIAELKAANAVKRCDVITERVENRITVFEQNKDKHLSSYKNISDKIQKFIDRLDDKGYDTTKLKTDLVTFDGKIKKFSNDYATYISLLRDTKQYTCGRSEGEFKAALQAAREQLKIVHDDSVDIRTFFAKTVRPDLLAIKDQKPKTDEETEKTDETSNNQTDTTTGTNSGTTTGGANE